MKLCFTLILTVLSLIARTQHTTPKGAHSKEQRLMGWYKITESTNLEIWSVGNNVLITQNKDDGNIQFKGYTNSGATVNGNVRGKAITIPDQYSTVIPFGGDGNAKIELKAKAKGTLNSGKLQLDFYLKSESGAEFRGVINAVRLHAQDTVIHDVYYEWLKYDLNFNPYEIGESNENGVKNGHWIFRDQQKRISHEVNYMNDTLNGKAIYFNYDNYPRTIKEEGLIVDGKRTGTWYNSARENKRRRWRSQMIVCYDSHGAMVSKTITFANGKPNVEIFYSANGEESWYRLYKKNGKMYLDSNENPYVRVVLIEKE
jgi:hypothetical protein